MDTSDFDIMLRLREETRDQHSATESAVDIPGHIRSRDAYRELLKRFYGFYVALDPAIETALREFGDTGFAYTPKTPWLERDLSALGLSGDAVRALPICDRLPPLSDPPSVMGTLYVIEGSSLGGKFIARSLQTELQIDAEGGSRFFSGHGTDIGAVWRGFGDAMRRQASPAEAEAIVAAAQRCFQLFMDWMSGRD